VAGVIRIAVAALALDQGDPPKAAALARDAGAALHEAKRVEEAPALALLITALLAQNKRADAEAEAARAPSLLAVAQEANVRIPLVLALARLEVSSRRPAAVAEGLKDAEAALAAVNRTPARTALEARCTLGELELAAGRPAGVEHLHDVERDATKMGFVRIARRAAASAGRR
jgi:hypothetical protein